MTTALPPPLPATVGFEGGIIDAAGAKVSGCTVGQRVVPLGVRGTWCEYVLVSPNQLIPVHDHVNDQTAAQFIVNPVTAWVMLTSELNLQPGDWLQTAAGSTLGQLVIQLGQMKGFKTINLVRRREQVDELLALGADAVVCTEDTDVVKLTETDRRQGRRWSHRRGRRQDRRFGSQLPLRRAKRCSFTGCSVCS